MTNPQETPEFLLGQIHTNVETLLKAQDRSMQLLEKHDKRLTSLEHTRTRGLAVFGVVCFVWSLAWDWVKSKIGLA